MMKKNIGRIVLSLIAVVFLCAGVIQGDLHTTWLKAIRICLECIGIG
ncbi:hypothetical protein HNP82_003225 [Catenibacillus scindens]|uniref:Thioredoxin n=1 Tax=Catenibacillus scindens TaxID=673271 RepID=A0A7W8HCP8_9FIRM|nr:CD1871A family CXXC motif-containing protein [Catenibacillus scindens]MBB5266071.1 hypothetical protein [Catenibacillus scindens]